MHLLHTLIALVQQPVHGSSDRESPANDCAEADEEPREGLGALFAVDDFHGGDVLI